MDGPICNFKPLSKDTFTSSVDTKQPSPGKSQMTSDEVLISLRLSMAGSIVAWWEEGSGGLWSFQLRDKKIDRKMENA